MDLDLNITREVQLKLLDIVKVFHRVCTDNNLRYYMIGGTMLGAIRHKGFIPWDDDIDVGMPRQDYEKLLSLPSDTWPCNVAIKTPYNSNDLIFPYTKIMDSNTTLVEDRLDGIVEGVYIDVFPLDGAGDSFQKAKARYKIYYLKQGLLYNNQDYEDKKTVLRRLFQTYARSKEVTSIYNDLEKYMKRLPFDSSRIIGNYAGAWGIKEFVNRDVFGTPKLFSFEGVSLNGVSNPELYLTSLYGDYMKLPPLDKQKSHHKFLYINLDKPFKDYVK